MDADVWREAKGVLAEALLCAPGERDAWVVAHCADPLLRREVQSYLHQYDEDFLESVLTVSNTFDLVTPSDADVAPDVHAGQHIGPYVVLERLGVGGMGHVFLGNDTRLHRKVALKCLIASASGVDLRSRILHEARAAARINHPNIAVVHDVVEHDNRPFLVMEYVEGENLAVMLRRELPPIDKVLSMGRQLASALVAAHAKGIIHRDLKPANIQVMPGGSVKILDFGVAQAMSMLTSDTTARTTSVMPLSTVATVRGEKGAVMHPGTPAYMSPEQMFGKEIDQRSDIYSLGVVMYEMVTGHRPYSAEDPLDVVLALSRRLLQPTRAEADLPSEVHDVIAKMLAVNVEERYQTAAELEMAFLALVGGDPALALPAARMGRSKLRAVGRVVAIVVAVPVCIGALGFAQTAAFNLTLGRATPFDTEPWTAWVESGVRSLVLPLIYQVCILIVLVAGRFVLRMLSLSEGIDHLLSTGLTRTRRLSSKLGLDDPIVLAQAVATVGFVAMLAIILAYFDVINASWGWINTFPTEQFFPLRPENRTGLRGLEMFDFALSALALFLGMAIFRIARLRARRGVQRGMAPLAIVVILLVATLVLLELPYRVQWRNKFDRVNVAGERCYILGEHDDDWLVYCPERAAPRNRVVRGTDPAVQRLGVVESIFTQAETSR